MTLPVAQSDEVRSATVELVRLLPQVVRWQASLMGLVIVCLVMWWQKELLDSSDGAVWLMRITAVVMTLAAVFVLDDSSRRATESMVLSRRTRVGMRLIVGVVLVAIGCLVPAVLTASQLSQAGLWLGVCVEVLAILAVAGAVSLVMQQHFGVDEPGQFAAIGMFAIFMTLQALGIRWPMLVGPGAEWTAAHLRWAALLALAAGVVAWQLRDPAAPSKPRFHKLWIPRER